MKICPYLFWSRLAVVAAVLLGGRAFAADDEHWTVEFAKAKADAAEGNKAILMEFTGSDWCPPCKALHKNVLVTDTFLTEVPKHFVLLKLDNPRDKSKQSEEEKTQYKELAANYKISGVPTIILADPDGVPFAKMVGYGGDAADKYVANLTQKAGLLKQRDEFLAQAKAVKGSEKAKALDGALSLLDDELVLTEYKKYVDEIIALDGENADGFKAKYEGLAKVQEIKSELKKIQRASRGDVDKGISEIDALIEETQAKGKVLQQALHTKAVMIYGKDKEACKQLLLDARKAAPDANFVEVIDGILKRVFKLDPVKLDQ